MTVPALIFGALVLGWYAGLAFGHLALAALRLIKRNRARDAWIKAWSRPTRD